VHADTATPAPKTHPRAGSSQRPPKGRHIGGRLCTALTASVCKVGLHEDWPRAF